VAVTGATSYTASWSLARKASCAVEEYSGVGAVSNAGNYNYGTATPATISTTLAHANGFLVSAIGMNYSVTLTASTGTLRQAEAGGTSSANSVAIIDNTAASGSVSAISTLSYLSAEWNAVSVELDPTSSIPQVASPFCSPTSGTVTVIVNCTIPTGATGCYTLNGDTPTTPATPNGTCNSDSGNELQYTGPITISVASTLKILATESGYTNSSVVPYTYSASGAASPPSCSPTSGIVPLVLSCTNPNVGTTIMCLSVGSTPVSNGLGTACTSGTSLGTSSPESYSVSPAETITVIAGVASKTDSAPVSYTYTSPSSTGVPNPGSNGIVKCTGTACSTSAIAGAGVDYVIPSGNVATATTATTAIAASAAGTECSAGSGARGVDASWNAIGCTAYDPSGAAATAQSNAETYSANASNLANGTVTQARLPATSTQTVATGTIALNTAVVATGQCETTATATATGALTTDRLVLDDPGADIFTVTGYNPQLSTGSLTVSKWITAGQINIRVCNPFLNPGPITPSALTLGWSVYRP